ncbi:MAG: DEAD/DEAH box helicase [Bacteroidetes bacterium]|nr:DEAD/DEAH box helicase [Bacteroidota bacterium]
MSDFLATTFPVTTPLFQRTVGDLLRRDDAIFKGPYLSLRLPFLKSASPREHFPDVPMGLTPFRHQEQAFRRLDGFYPRSTLLATGTGSGKTESFLFPVLNYCLQMRKQGVGGIKAILIYPMNALATDQSRRIARIIDANEALRAHVSAGLYVGQKDETPVPLMTPQSIITDRDVLRQHPPDILLTNYKMLDYLLIRPRDAELWKNNGPETLRFLVVDELHTFDGAQGTDLACLLRRLKARLGTPPQHLCCVGTSATLGAEQDSARLRDYAGRVFGEAFDADAVITESVMDAEEFLGGKGNEENAGVIWMPGEEALGPRSGEAPMEYVRRQAALWIPDVDAWPEKDEEFAFRLSEALKSVPFFRALLRALDGKPRGIDTLFETMFGSHEHPEPALRERFAAAVESMAACVSAARSMENGIARPFLHARMQLWFRELRRMVCTVGAEPRLEFSDELPADQLQRSLPMLHCRECGATAWGGVLPAAEHRVRAGLQAFYQRYFSFATDVVFLFPEGDASAMGEQQQYFCPSCLTLHAREEEVSCSFCGSEDAAIPVLAWQKVTTSTEKRKARHDCPYCEGRDSMTILGSRAASLIAVVNAQMFASPFNDDKKLLAFSDSVQDASHRAGFFTARTWRFNFRTALLQFLQGSNEEHGLDQLPAAFIRHARARWDLEHFIGIFLPPDMDWLEDYEHFKRVGTLPADSNLLDLLERRIDWEVCSEFGFNARIGRTLEKSGTGVAGPRADAIDAACAALLPRMRDEIGVLRGMTDGMLRGMLLGLITQMKNRGGVEHPELRSYVENFGSTYLLNRGVHMPGFGPHSRTPAFLTDGRSDRFDRLSATAGRKSWYEIWVLKCLLPLNEIVEPYVEDILRMVLETLEAHSVLRRTDLRQGHVWGLLPEAITVTRAVQQLRCGACGHAASVPTAQREAWTGAPCMRPGCAGAYAAEEQRDDYYASLYSTGDVARLVSQEHTGLLSSGERKDVEERFMAGTKPWDPNLLSCTPTLEMGVDIGDLSSVILCSVPPSQANYVQRIGRAGRRDGNAFTVAVAEMRPHDQYFFSDPQDMISGAVTPPGCFLNAPAVLERQFVGYCFDRWVQAGARETDLPAKLGAVLKALKQQPVLPDEGSDAAPNAFPQNLLSFITAHRDELFEAFTRMFAAELDTRTQDYLRMYVYGTEGGSDLAYRVMERLHLQLREVSDLESRVKALTKLIKDLKTDPAAGESREERLHELTGEQLGLNAILRELRNKHVLQFFTDEGFLPNYAFPESGIMLRSIIYRRSMKSGKSADGGGAMQSWYYEYERPAATALKELAPNSSFYAGGRKVTVDQVNMRLSEPEEWRFCPVCAHAERDSAEGKQGGCPHCNDSGWRDAGQKRRLLRLRQVMATASDRESRSRDESEEREPSFFVRDTLVHPDPSTISNAWALENDDVPFGFEFVGRARFVDINFGAESSEGETVRIAGRELRRPGFAVCRECGRVQNERNRRKHTSTCKFRDKDDAALFTETLYLYREFTTEAIRMLLPATTTAAPGGKLHSFSAALLLGLREKFAGNIDHLQTTVMQEPVPGSGISKHYLVLYDTVPGGTGYLKELMQSNDVLREVFTLALRRMNDCDCRHDPGKDGCYRCVYAYRLSYAMADISRNTAISMLGDILRGWDSLHAVKTIDEITINPLIESELEGLFLETLRDARVGDRPVTLKKAFLGHDSGYSLRVGEREYGIVQQKSLGEAEGVTVPSRADFVIFSTEEGRLFKPVVVFTDGYEYHAQQKSGGGRVGYDLNQRMALLRSGRFHVWSLTWDDLLRYGKKITPEVNPFLGIRPATLHTLLHQPSVTAGVRALVDAPARNPFSLLLDYLAGSGDAEWERFAVLHALAGIENKSFVSEKDVDARRALLWEAPDADAITDVVPAGSGQMLYDERKAGVGIVSRSLQITAAADPARQAEIRVLLRFFDSMDHAMKDGYRIAWNAMLSALNVYQFIPAFAIVADSGVGDGDPSWLDGDLSGSAQDVRAGVAE